MIAVMTDAVRLALPAEAGQIAAVQRRAWSQLPPPLAQAFLAGIDLDSMINSWRTAITRPPLAQFRVLVALAGERVVGFAALGPSDDPDATPGEDGLVAEFAIDPPAQRQGHGSRLLNACVDTLRADGFERATWWVRSSDDDLRAFTATAGWEPDGSHSEVGSGAVDGPRMKLIRLHTDISAC